MSTRTNIDLKIFEYPLTVTESDVDGLNHVNNTVYLRWLIDAASAHSEHLGYGLKEFLAAGGAFVVRRHELDYLRPAFVAEELVVHTWVTDFETDRTTREYKIVRKKDQKTIMVAKTLWVFVNMKTGKATKIPDKIATDYGFPPA